MEGCWGLLEEWDCGRDVEGWMARVFLDCGVGHTYTTSWREYRVLTCRTPHTFHQRMRSNMAPGYLFREESSRYIYFPTAHQNTFTVNIRILLLYRIFLLYTFSSHIRPLTFYQNIKILQLYTSEFFYFTEYFTEYFYFMLFLTHQSTFTFHEHIRRNKTISFRANPSFT